jgi:hypothetical protein
MVLTPRDALEQEVEGYTPDGTEPWATNFLYPNNWSKHRKVCIRSRDPTLNLGRSPTFALDVSPAVALTLVAVCVLVLNHFAQWSP